MTATLRLVDNTQLWTAHLFDWSCGV